MASLATCIPCKSVNNCSIPSNRDACSPGTYWTLLVSLPSVPLCPFFTLFCYGRRNRPLGVLNVGIDNYPIDPLFYLESHPGTALSPFGKVSLMEKDRTCIVLSEFINIRIAAGKRNSCIYMLNDLYDLLDNFLHLGFRLYQSPVYRCTFIILPFYHPIKPILLLGETATPNFSTINSFCNFQYRRNGCPRC